MNLCIGGINIINNIGISKKRINPALEHLVQDNVSPQRPVPGIENGDPVAKAAVEIIGSGI
jgi:hypothetical protein